MFKPPSPGSASPMGKGSKRQSLALGQKATIMPGDTLNRMFGQYGKAAPPALNASPPPAVDNAPNKAGVNAVRGGSGGMKTHPRQGGIGPGPNGSYGSARSYPKDTSTEDVI